MAFTNTWDNSVPADTEVANLYAKNLRDFRLDTQQRMAAMSGLRANAPTFEAGFAGVLYFATDTAQILQWSGSAWSDITQQIIGTQVVFKDQTLKNETGGFFGQVYSINMVAGVVGPSTRFRIQYFYLISNSGSGGVTTLLQFASANTQPQTILTLSVPGGSLPSGHVIVAEGGNFGSPGAQNWGVVDLTSTLGTNVFASQIDTANQLTAIIVYCECGVGSSVYFYGITVELF